MSSSVMAFLGGVLIGVGLGILGWGVVLFRLSFVRLASGG